MIKQQRGVALIQILLISLVITLLSVQLSYTARNQVEQVSAIEQRLHAQLESYSVQQQLLFKLLANDEYQHNIGSDANNMPDYWSTLSLLRQNGAWYPLTTELEVSVKDFAGMLPIQYPKHPAWPVFLRYRGLDEGRIRHFLTTLEDFQDKDKVSIGGSAEPSITPSGHPYINLPIEHPMWLERFLIDWPELYQDSYDNMHVINHYVMSPQGMSDEMLSGLFGEEAYKQIKSHINDNTINRLDIHQWLNNKITSEDLGSLPSVNKRLAVRYYKDGMLWEEQIDVSLSALTVPPITVIGRK